MGSWAPEQNVGLGDGWCIPLQTVMTTRAPAVLTNVRGAMKVVWILYICFIQQTSFWPFPLFFLWIYLIIKSWIFTGCPDCFLLNICLHEKASQVKPQTSWDLILKILLFRNLVLPRLANHSDKFETHKATNSSFHFTTLAASQTTIPGEEYKNITPTQNVSISLAGPYLSNK